MPTPLRINVTGNAGSGKSTLAADLGQKLGYPVHNLDSIVWLPHWKKRAAIERENLEDELVREPTWIIDGVSKRVRDAADLVVVLDASRSTCIFRAAKRNSRHLFHSRPGLPEHCPEILIIPRLIQIILKYPSLIRSEILRESEISDKYLWVTANRDSDDIVQSINFST